MRYWGGALSLVSDTGTPWPGFSYTPEEKQLFTVLAEEVGLGELGLFLLLNSLIFIALSAAVIVGGFIPLIKALYPIAQSTPALAVFILLGLVCAIMAGIGLPLSVVLSAGLLGKLFRHPEKPDVSTQAVGSLFQKVQWQCLRAGLLVTATGLVAAAYMAYHENRIAVLVQTLVRCVMPALGVSILAYFIGRRAASGD